MTSEKVGLQGEAHKTTQAWSLRKRLVRSTRSTEMEIISVTITIQRTVSCLAVKSKQKTNSFGMKETVMDLFRPAFMAYYRKTNRHHRR